MSFTAYNVSLFIGFNVGISWRFSKHPGPPFAFLIVLSDSRLH